MNKKLSEGIEKEADEMLGLSEIEENGTVTLPDRVIEILGIKPGDKVTLENNDDHTITITKA